MRRVTKEAVTALYNSTAFKKGNTSVEILPNVSILYLHGHRIAYLYNDPNKTLSITNCGWFSNTTKERLNGLPGVSISQKAGTWYLFDKTGIGREWDGKLIDIK